MRNKDFAEYAAWIQMRGRCRNPRHKSFARYGGRGIRVCERWDDFRVFIADVGRRPSPSHSLDRINNDGHYEPENCRWATPQQQARNSTLVRPLTVGGRTQCIRAWAAEVGLSRSVIEQRLARGWSPTRAVRAPLRRQGQRQSVTFRGETRPLAEWARITGIQISTLSWRLREGWATEQAMTTPPGGKRRTA